MPKSPQIENGHLDIANELVEKLAKTQLSGYESRILWAIWRKTYSWHKKEDWISYNQFKEITGIKQDSNISRTLKRLIERQIVIKNDKLYGFNKSYQNWQLSTKKLSKLISGVIKNDKKKLSKLISPIYTKETTKETITKEIVTNVTTGFGNPDVNLVSAYFLQVFQIPKEDCTAKQSRQYWYHLLRESKTGPTGVKWLIDQAYGDEFYRNNITSSKDLYYKRIKILARKRGTVPTFSVMGEGGGNEEMAADDWDKSLLLN